MWGNSVGYSPVFGDGQRRKTSILLVALAVMFSLIVIPGPEASATREDVVWLTQSDFTYGTYIIDQPGTYKLKEDISFNPNSPATLSKAVATGVIPAELAAALGLANPVDAYHSGMPLFTQFQFGPGSAFSPGGPLDARYDPAGYGVGFFAAIAIQTDGVTLDLNGHTLEQSAEHALLQRFFAIIELADQPFLPAQGPASFGSELDAATNVTIKNGTLGRSSHHGIHGNANVNVTVKNVNFNGYEVGAVALNGVDGLLIQNSVARNRRNVPVVGTFSSAMFIKAYIDDLVRTSSATTLTVDGEILSATDIQSALQTSINNVHHDVIVAKKGYIDPATHPDEYALFHNKHGLIDGNSYSFLLNNIGVAVNGFPFVPDGVTKVASQNIVMKNVKVVDQDSFINEIPAIDSNGTAAGGTAIIDPVGAVFQVRNLHPVTGAPVTISSLDDATARYLGNVVANAQAFVAKAKLNGDLGTGVLDVTRLNMPTSVVNWVEGVSGSETLASIGTTYFCNGDSMFHVNKGTIGFKIDAAKNVRLTNTGVIGLENLGLPGDGICGDYSEGQSHPADPLPGYGGAFVRAYTFSGSEDVVVNRATASGLSSMSGPAVGFAVLNDSDNVRFVNSKANDLNAGWGSVLPTAAPNGPSYAAGFYISANSNGTVITKGCATSLFGYDGTYFVHDLSPGAVIKGSCSANN